MRQCTKRWLLTAAALVAVGLLLFTAVMTAFRWDFSGLNTVEYRTASYEIREDFSSIEISGNTADIVFAVSVDGMCSIECYVPENFTHFAEVRNGTLFVQASAGDWKQNIGIDFRSPEITVYLPKTEYVSLAISESTGDIEILEEFCFDEVDISLSTGNVRFCASSSGTVSVTATTGEIRIEHGTVDALVLCTTTGEITVSDVTCQGDLTANVTTGELTVTDTTCKNLSADGTTGDVSLKRLLAAEKIKIERSTGDVRFDGADAADLFVKTSTGDVTGTLRSDKVFYAESSTGSISVPKTLADGICDIKTSTGDIRIEIAK